MSQVVKRIDATHVSGHTLVCSFRNIGPIEQDLLIEVLFRLPPKILMRCCCVCKPCYVLIHRYCVSRITPFAPFLGLDVRIKISSTDLLIGRAVIPVWPLVFNIHDGCNGFSPDAKHLLDSQDGLMLFRHPSESENKYVLWNPNTKQFLLVPRPRNPETFVALAVEFRHWKPGREMDLFKIVSFPKKRGAFWKTLDVFYSRNSTWIEHKVKYMPRLPPRPG
ncbi:hypothetical protein V6N13_091251 [Hibiscus sabdariffa]|uniref:F-box domain-containing protein n=1 Tax=Hibiscus sabdariffa TaxID=183260 RepID=A0ABR2BV34_9ROSI